MSENNTNEPQYDPQPIIQKAIDQYNQSSDLEPSRLIYQTALLEWTDDATFADSPTLRSYIRKSVIPLWIAYAELHYRTTNARAYKSAQEAYESAVADGLAGDSGEIWLSYADFHRRRKRFRSAQSVYLKALIDKDGGGDEGGSGGGPAVKDAKERDVLWNEFLAMMREQKDRPDMTLEELKGALNAVDTEASLSSIKTDGSDAPPLKKTRLEKDADIAISLEQTPSSSSVLPSPPPSSLNLPTPPSGASPPESDSSDKKSTSPPPQSSNSNTHSNSKRGIITAAAVEAIATPLLESSRASMPPDVTAAWLARDGTSSPSIPDPPLFNPSPPRLSDASGRDLLGDSMALDLVRLLLGKNKNKNKNKKGHNQEDVQDDKKKSTTKDNNNNKKLCPGDVILDICQACWLMTALHERETSRRITSFDAALTSTRSDLETKLLERESVVPAGPALDAVRQTNDMERSEFIRAVSERRRGFLDEVAWSFRSLLANQQILLKKAGLLGFEGGAIADGGMIAFQAKVCSVVHSAFYLRSRIGRDAHVSMLKSQEVKLMDALKNGAGAGPSSSTGQQHPVVVVGAGGGAAAAAAGGTVVMPSQPLMQPSNMSMALQPPGRLSPPPPLPPHPSVTVVPTHLPGAPAAQQSMGQVPGAQIGGGAGVAFAHPAVQQQQPPPMLQGAYPGQQQQQQQQQQGPPIQVLQTNPTGGGMVVTNNPPVGFGGGGNPMMTQQPLVGQMQQQQQDGSGMNKKGAGGGRNTGGGGARRKGRGSPPPSAGSSSRMRRGAGSPPRSRMPRSRR